MRVLLVHPHSSYECSTSHCSIRRRCARFTGILFLTSYLLRLWHKRRLLMLDLGSSYVLSWKPFDIEAFTRYSSLQMSLDGHCYACQAKTKEQYRPELSLDSNGILELNSERLTAWDAMRISPDVHLQHLVETQCLFPLL